ncbi:MAG: hypothetical protein Q8S02_12385 [Hydrogenophaga sp.]|nr:hypothetical protein [Hydrogenophaga sp.]
MNLAHIQKPLSTTQAEAARLGATVVPIEDDTGRPEFIFTDGPMTLRTGDLGALQQAVAALRKRQEARHEQA